MKTMRQRGLMFRIVVLVMVLSLFPLSFPASADNIIESSPAELEGRDENAVRATIRNESEYNNSMTMANIIEDDDTTYGRIAYSGDVDYYRIVFESDGLANFWVGDIPSGKDYDLYLYDSNGTELDSSTSNNSERAQELISSYRVFANTVYYIKVVGFNCYDLSAYYQLRAKKVTQYETESNNTQSAADELINGDTMYGRIGSNGDADYYKIQFSHSGKANFWVGNIPSGKNYDLYVYNISGILLYSSTTNNSERTQELIDHATVAAGTWYFVKVVGNNCYDATTYYQLRVKHYTVKEVKILYDSTCTCTVEQIHSEFADATAVFASRYGIEFKICSTLSSTALNGGNCPNTSHNEYCNEDCGLDINCYEDHHKSAHRLLNLGKTNKYVCRIVGHKMCFYQASKEKHMGVYGLGYPNDLNTIITTKSDDFARTIQHELTHNLGGEHDNCKAGQKCVLQGYMDNWCDYCMYAVNTSS